MKFPRKDSHFRSLKFAPFAILSFFIFTNVTGIMFSRVMAPVAAASPAQLELPADIPTSGDKDLDRGRWPSMVTGWKVDRVYVGCVSRL